MSPWCIPRKQQQQGLKWDKSSTRVQETWFAIFVQMNYEAIISLYVNCNDNKLFYYCYLWSIIFESIFLIYSSEKKTYSWQQQMKVLEYIYTT